MPTPTFQALPTKQIVSALPTTVVSRCVIASCRSWSMSTLALHLNKTKSISVCHGRILTRLPLSAPVGPPGSAGIVAPDSTGKVPRARSSVVWHVSAGVAIQGSHFDSADAVPRYRHRAVLCELRGQEQSSGVSNRRCLSLGFEIPRSMFPDGSELVTMG